MRGRTTGRRRPPSWSWLLDPGCLHPADRAVHSHWMLLTSKQAYIGTDDDAHSLIDMLQALSTACTARRGWYLC